MKASHHQAVQIGLDGKLTAIPLTLQEAAALDRQWEENFTAGCEHRSLALFRRMSRRQKLRLFREAKSRSITSYAGTKRLAVHLGLVEDFPEPP